MLTVLAFILYNSFNRIECINLVLQREGKKSTACAKHVCIYTHTFVCTYIYSEWIKWMKCIYKHLVYFPFAHSLSHSFFLTYTHCNVFWAFVVACNVCLCMFGACICCSCVCERESMCVGVCACVWVYAVHLTFFKSLCASLVKECSLLFNCWIRIQIHCCIIKHVYIALQCDTVCVYSLIE